MIEFDYAQDNIKLIQKIARMPAFGHFEESDLQGLLQVAASKIRKYEPDELILAEGSCDHWIYFLVSGKTKIVKDGKELSIMARKGDVFGEMGIIDGSPRSASVFAVNETVCLAIDARHIDELTGNDRLAFGYVLYRILSEILASRLRITSAKLVKAEEEIDALMKSGLQF
ncbi:MAG: cyclic nucleotide-binding domain-containing protein [Desulfobacterales bacterium]|nr:cyclic nucleotide-binding domain-containing protein [Desulfobacterales bacterium]